ncbi:hypothetical protein V8E54_001305 [Elaphomyces granulatus]
MSGPMVALFSSYGSASTKPVPTPTPIKFNKDQRVSICRSQGSHDIGLFFTHDEFKDVVKRVCKQSGEHGEPFLPSQELVEYIWEFTNGHPAGLRTILDGLQMSMLIRPFRKTASESDFFHIQSTTGFSRGLPDVDDLQNNPGIAQLLREALVSNRIVGIDNELHLKPALDACFKNGWLQAESTEFTAEGDESGIVKTVYVFASNMHRRYAEYLLVSKAPFPSHMIPSVKDPCFAAIRKFNPTRLRSREQGVSAGAKWRPVEAQYQDELYRACYVLLDKNLYLSSEWAGSTTGGRVDFLVTSMGWAIECIREGDRLEEHIARFQEGGRYYQWIQSKKIQDYIMLDFRKSPPRKSRDDDHLYFIVFSDDFTSYETYNAKLDPVGKRTGLLESSLL